LIGRLSGMSCPNENVLIVIPVPVQHGAGWNPTAGPVMKDWPYVLGTILVMVYLGVILAWRG